MWVLQDSRLGLLYYPQWIKNKTADISSMEKSALMGDILSVLERIK
jgi:hypothetical protein